MKKLLLLLLLATAVSCAIDKAGAKAIGDVSLKVEDFVENIDNNLDKTWSLFNYWLEALIVGGAVGGAFGGRKMMKGRKGKKKDKKK